jgi:hypothetical protein
MTDTSQTIEASGRTGDRCRVTGPYRSSRNARVILFVREGEAFPVDADGSSTTWTLVSEEDSE